MNYRFYSLAIAFLISAFYMGTTAAKESTTAAAGTITKKTPSPPTKTVPFDQLNQKQTSHFLKWSRDSKKCQSFCGGHYFNSTNLISTPNPQNFNEAPMSISANKPAFFTRSGPSTIEGDVVLTQPGREISADNVLFYRDQQTGRITKSILSGHVNFREYGKLIVANRGSLDFINKKYVFERGIYRIFTNTPTGLANIWGRAKKAVSITPGVMKFNQATYETCPPDDPSWHLWGSHLTINRNTGRGEIYNAFILLGPMPIFYTPYFNFSIDNTRKSGFLMPTIDYSRTSGYNVNVPYYFNLAPNYDAVFTPEYFSSRGVLLNGIFRYLTPTSSGDFSANYIHHDNLFIDFRNQAQAGTASANAIKKLKDSSDQRGFFSLNNSSSFSEHWRGALNIKYVTDDYFLQDFDSLVAPTERDQLLNKAELSYFGENWNFLSRVQFFQTLHPITQSTTLDQYQRVPQINLAGFFPDGFAGIDYRIDSEVVNFRHRNNFDNDQPFISGARANITPSISRLFNWLDGDGYIIPRLQLQTTGYSLYNCNQEFSKHNITRLYPLLSVNSGVIFSRETSLFNENYTQILEPRVFYLLVPVIDQNEIPVFDTYLPAFDFNQLFRTNRFSGVDRVGDANQFSLALTTKLLNDYGQEKLNAGLGQIAIIHKHQVTVPGTTDPLKYENLSPLVGQLQYFINSQMNTSFNFSWDPNYHKLNTATVNFQYLNATKQVVNLWYNYTLNGDQLIQNQIIDLNRVGASCAWQLLQHWNLIGSFNYSASSKIMQNYLYGFEYNSCCWALRIIFKRDFISIANEQKKYDYRFYTQLLFKGLGDLGSRKLSSRIATQIAGYQDQLATGF